MKDHTLSNVLLVAGYATATGAALRFVPMWRQRRLRRFVAFEAGTATVVTGLLLRGRHTEAGLNAAALVGLALAWIVTKPRR